MEKNINLIFVGWVERSETQQMLRNVGLWLMPPARYREHHTS
jgi:hypothetical protein